MKLFRLFLTALSALFFLCPLLFSEENMYTKAGIPPTDRPWRGADYAKAANVISQHLVSIPRIGQKDGTAFWNRVTSTESLSYHRDGKASLEDRMTDYTLLQKGINAIQQNCLNAAKQGTSMHAELAQCLAFTLHTMVSGSRLVEEYIARAPKDGREELRDQGRAQMQTSITQTFLGAIATLKDRKTFTSEDHSVLLAAMAETCPELRKFFSPEHRVEFHKHLAEIKGDFKEGKNADRLARLIDLVEP